MGGKIDFEGLADQLLGQAQSLLQQWLPGGKLVGPEWTCGDLSGVAGNSCKANIRNGKWSDFKTGVSGGDLISLYAAIHNIKNGEAAKRLSGKDFVQHTQTAKKLLNPPKLVLPPDPPPPLPRKPHFVWSYRDRKGRLLYYQTRTDVNGEKQFAPYSWDGTGWISKSPPAPRPLYGLELLDTSAGKHVLIVEGEKSADAARQIVGSRYLVVTWSNGTNSHSRADWTPLFDRKNALLWPDADPPGVKAMQEIAKLLTARGIAVKVIDVGDRPLKWDAADAASSGWGWTEFVAWAKPRASLFKPSAVEAELMPPTPPPIADEENDEADVSAKIEASWKNLNLQLSKQGVPIPNADNLMRILEQWPAIKERIWSDPFRCRTLVRDGDTCRVVGEYDLVEFLVSFQRNFGLARLAKGTVSDAISLFASRNKKNEPLDWMETLIWDKKSRINDFFPRCFGCEDTEYARAVSKNFWISMVARIYAPGCQADNMVILEGAQGKLKTTAFRIIGGRWYAAAQGHLGKKDFWQGLQGRLLVEMSELASFNKSEANLIKSELSRTIDIYRPSYAEFVGEFPRQCIFVGSTNEDAYLNDPTGARRFWPLRVGEGLIDIETIRQDREQLFAEAVFKYKAGENHYEVPQQETVIEQELRRQMDEWESLIEDFVEGRDMVTMTEISGPSCLKIEMAHFGMVDQKRIGAILRALGWAKRRKRDETRAMRNIWKRIQSCPSMT